MRQRVHRVRVVPEQPEVGGRRAHLDQPANGFPGVGHTGGVGEHRHRPHALDRRVDGDEFFDQVDVRAVLAHRDRDHLDAQGLGDGEVPVVAGRRAEELDARLVIPGPSRIHAAVQHREDDEIVHQLEAGVVAGDQVRHRDAEQLAEYGPQFGQAVQPAVVAGVGALLVAVVVAGQAQQLVGQVELLGARFAAGEVQGQLHSLQLQHSPAGGAACAAASSSGVRESNDTMLPFTVPRGAADRHLRGPRAPDRAH